MEADLDRDGKISFEEFTKMVENTDVSMSMTLGKGYMNRKLSPLTYIQISFDCSPSLYPILAWQHRVYS